jgi:hypothetical protein
MIVCKITSAQKIIKKEGFYDDQQMDDSGNRSENDGQPVSGQTGRRRQGTEFEFQAME